MANFKKNEVEKLVKDYLEFLDVTSHSSFVNNAGDENKLRELFGDNGYECINELTEFYNELAQAPSIIDVIKTEILDKFTEDEKATFSSREIVSDARIDWKPLTDALEARFAAKDEAKKVKDSVKLIIGRTLGEDASYTKAALKNIQKDGDLSALKSRLAEVEAERDRESHKASFFKKATIVSAVSGGVALLTTLGLLIGVAVSKGNIKEANALMQAQEALRKAYAQSETVELQSFKDKIAELLGDGVLTFTEQDQLKEEIKGFEATDKIEEFGHSSTGEMNALLSAEIANQNVRDQQAANSSLQSQYDDILQKYNALVNANGNSFDYVQFLSDVEKVQDDLIAALADNNFTDQEKQDIKNKIVLLNAYQNAIAQNIADKFGVSVDSIYATIDYQIAKLNTEIADLNNQIKDLETEINTKDILLSDKNEMIAKLNKEMINLGAKVVSLEQKVADLEQQLANSGSDPALLAQLQQANNNLQIAREEVAKLQALNDALTAENGTLKTENSTLKDKVDQLNNEVANLTSTVSGLNTQVDALNAQIDALTAENTDLKQLCAQYAQDVQDLNGAYDQLLAEYNTKVAAHNKLLKDFDALEDLYQNALNGNNTAEVQRLEAEINRLNAALVQSSNNLDAAEAEIDALNQKLNELEFKVSDLASQLAQSDAEFIKSLYESVGGNSNGKTKEQMIKELSEMFDIQIDKDSSNVSGDLGNVPHK